MKYALVSVGLLFTLNAFAAGGFAGGATDNATTQRTSSSGLNVERLSHQACDTFCQENGSGHGWATCNVTLYGGTQHATSATENPDGTSTPASATGDTISLSYDVVCNP